MINEEHVFFHMFPMPHHRQKGFRSDPNGFPGDQALVARFEEFAGSGETCSHSPQGVAFFVMIFPALYRHDLWQGKQDIPPRCKEKPRICLRFHMLSITKAFTHLYIHPFRSPRSQVPHRREDSKDPPANDLARWRPAELLQGEPLC